jgi:hypothetical protein
MKFSEYKKFFTDESIDVRIKLVNVNSVEFEEYKLLFTDECAKVRRLMAVMQYNETYYNEDFFSDEFDNDPFMHLAIKVRTGVSPLLW